MPEPSCSRERRTEHGVVGGVGQRGRPHPVRLLDHPPDLVALRLKPHRPHRHLQLISVDGAGVIGVKKLRQGTLCVSRDVYDRLRGHRRPPTHLECLSNLFQLIGRQLLRRYVRHGACELWWALSTRPRLYLGRGGGGARRWASRGKLGGCGIAPRWLGFAKGRGVRVHLAQ